MTNDQQIDKASFKEYVARFKFKTDADEFQCPDNGEYIQIEDCELPCFGKGCILKSNCKTYGEQKHILQNTNI